MLITPSLLHVKTHGARHRRETATRLQSQGLDVGYAMDGLLPDQVLERLDLPVLPHGTEVTEWQCIRDDHAAMADAGEWDDLLEALRFADQERTMVSGGHRVAPLISEGLRAPLLAAVERGDRATALVELSRLEAVQALHPRDYAAALLLAQARIDIAIALRRGVLQDPVPGAAARLFADAESVLAAHDPIEEMSPLLAATRYRLASGLPDGADLYKDWYEDWCDLDPEDAQAHASHALDMLPGGFGSVPAFERAARKAAGLTSQITGRAAYAIFHMTALAHLGVPLASLDLDLFLQGLADFQTATECQLRANIAANVLSGLLHQSLLAGPGAGQQAQRLRAALADVLTHRLREVHLDSWDHGPDRLAFALAQVFGPALQRGARITRHGGGMGARVPRD